MRTVETTSAHGPEGTTRSALQVPLLRRSIQGIAGASIQFDFYWAISSNHTRRSNVNSHRKLSSKHVHVSEIKKEISRTLTCSAQTG